MKLLPQQGSKLSHDRKIKKNYDSLHELIKKLSKFWKNFGSKSQKNFGKNAWNFPFSYFGTNQWGEPGRYDTSYECYGQPDMKGVGLKMPAIYN